MNWVKLPNGVRINVDELQMIIRQDLNEYIGILRNCPANPKLDLDAMDLLDVELKVKVLEAPSKPLIIEHDAENA